MSFFLLKCCFLFAWVPFFLWNFIHKTKTNQQDQQISLSFSFFFSFRHLHSFFSPTNSSTNYSTPTTITTHHFHISLLAPHNIFSLLVLLLLLLLLLHHFHVLLQFLGLNGNILPASHFQLFGYICWPLLPHQTQERFSPFVPR